MFYAEYAYSILKERHKVELEEIYKNLEKDILNAVEEDKDSVKIVLSNSKDYLCRFITDDLTKLGYSLSQWEYKILENLNQNVELEVKW